MILNMRLFDSTIAKVQDLIKDAIILKKEEPWQDIGKSNVVLRNEIAYELGAGNLPALSYLGITSNDSFINSDEVYLIGQDLLSIKNDTPYARLAFIRIDDDLLNKQDNIYDEMKKISFARYVVNPKGFMTRISSSKNREPVRVSKEAIENKINFSSVGQLYINAYKKNPLVKNCHIIFITDPLFDYLSLEKYINSSDKIMDSLDHVLKNFKMDCSSCNLKSICEEVDGLKELHFK